MARLSDYLRLLVPQRRARWSIGIYAGATPWSLSPHPALAGQPALDAAALGSVRADGVADPFIVMQGGAWWMFFEVENRDSGRGEIGLATSADGVSWRFDGIVLQEPFHLSYPHVFEWEGQHYMLPECSAAGSVRLYKASSFPRQWEFHAELLRGDLADATPFRHGGRWWIIAQEGFHRRDAMVVFHAPRLEGPWTAHARNPIVTGNRRISRPAGRMIGFDGKLVRLAQDGEPHYGRSVTAFEIDELTPDAYAEHPLAGPAELLGPAGRGWNADGMHHMDAHRLAPDAWLACVDGRRTVWKWPVADRVSARLRRVGQRAS